MDAEFQKKIINQNTILGVAVNIILFGVKLAAGILSSSTAMITDAIHSLSDLFTDIIVFFSLHWSIKSPDDEHPYGHGKIENIAAVIVGLLLIQLGLWFVYDSAHQVITGNVKVLKNNWAVWAAVASIVLKEALFHITRIMGNKIKSDAMIANAWHHRSDAFSSIVALIGLGASLLGFRFGDIIAAGLIAVILVYIGGKILFQNANTLIEASVKPEELDQAREVLRTQEGITDFRRLRLRQVGKDVYGEVNIEVKGDLSVKEGHDIALRVKQRLFQTLTALKDISIHIDPSQTR